MRRDGSSRFARHHPSGANVLRRVPEEHFVETLDDARETARRILEE